MNVMYVRLWLHTDVCTVYAGTDQEFPRLWDRTANKLMKGLQEVGRNDPLDARVIPCPGPDVVVRDYIATSGFVIDKRLDAGKLETALKLVVEKKFPRAAARWVTRDGVGLLCLLLRSVLSDF